MLTRNIIHFYYTIRIAEFYVCFHWYFPVKSRPKVRSFAGKMKICYKIKKKSQRIQWVLNPGLLGDRLISSPLHHSFLMVGVGKIYTNVSHIVLNNKKLLSFFWIHVPKDEVIHGISQSYAVPCTREIYILRYQNSTHVEPRFFYLFGIFPCNTGVQKCEP